MRLILLLGILLLIMVTSCTYRNERIMESQYKECEFRNTNQSYINYTCPNGSEALGINRETGELDVCDTNQTNINGTIYVNACIKKEGFDDCYKEYQKEELVEFCKIVYCDFEGCVDVTDWS